MREISGLTTCRVLVVAVVVVGVASLGWAQGHVHMKYKPEAATTEPPPIRVTMEALHASGGVPVGWKFLLPQGDAAQGRKVFVALECFACHEVNGEDFPRTMKTALGAGPELTDMGAHHPAEYFAESIVNPNRVIVVGSGYTGPDGLSRMPDYSEQLSARGLIDLVAYLRSLTGPGREHDGQAGVSKPKT